jgi:hypothetical protein
MWEDRLFDEVLGRYGAPAYVRRGRAVEDAWEDLLDHCRGRRREWLHLVRIRFGQLRALAGDWAALLPLLRDEGQFRVMEDLHADLSPRLRFPVEPTTSSCALAGALYDLVESIERFNKRWREYLATVDLGRVNEVRENYNCYYLLEKECATQSASVARQGYRPLPPVTVEDVARRLPTLPLPQLKGERRGVSPQFLE